MKIKTFTKFRNFVYDSCGISLNETKASMVASRISKRMLRLGIETHEDYLKFLMEDNGGEETIKFIDVISTNTTFFFRESDHFNYLTTLISDLIYNRQNKIRVWCAASSTGEEPYTIAMTMLEADKRNNTDIKLLATDISTKVLGIAKTGEYEAEKLKKVPSQLRKKYFTVAGSRENGLYTANASLKQMILFRRLNLSKPPYPMKGPLDIVFCRNVMIYFDNEVRTRLITEIHRLLKPGGYLITGHAESLSSLNVDFKCIKPSIYIKT